MTKKKPVNLNRHLKKNPFTDSGDLHQRFFWEYEQRIRLASALLKREELAKVRHAQREEKKMTEKQKLHKFLVSYGGIELLRIYLRYCAIGFGKELGYTQHPDYDKKYGKVCEEE